MTSHSGIGLSSASPVYNTHTGHGNSGRTVATSHSGGNGSSGAHANTHGPSPSIGKSNNYKSNRKCMILCIKVLERNRYVDSERQLKLPPEKTNLSPKRLRMNISTKKFSCTLSANQLKWLN